MRLILTAFAAAFSALVFALVLLALTGALYFVLTIPLGLSNDLILTGSVAGLAIMLAYFWRRAYARK